MMGRSSNQKGLTGSVNTLVGPNTEILGDVRFTGGLHLDGTIRGKVAMEAPDGATLSVSETGVIEGNVQVATIVLNGTVKGDVYASEKITLQPKARVTGNVYYQILEMQSGSQVNGQLVYGVDQPAGLAVTQQAAGGAEPTVLEVSDVKRVRPV